MKRLAKAILRRFGYELHAYNHQRNHQLRKMKLITDRAINLVIDAGANVGQFAEEMRRLGYSGRIVSLEPIPALFSILKAKADRTTGWEALNLAVGDRDGEAELNVGVISEISSFLPATGAATTREWTQTTRQTVRVRTLDSLLPEIKRGHERLYLKMDIQGYERRALAGGERTLAEALAIELELSTISHYEGEWLLPEMVQYISQQGFGVFSIEPVVVDYQSGRVLQFEVLFARNSQPQGGAGVSA